MLDLSARLPRALDVACGTGLSTQALTDIAEDIVGVDPSAAMLAEAVKAPGVSYQAAAAEQLPFGEASFDLATVASGFHWFDREAFFGEARRVLKPSGWLVIYEFGMSGRAVGVTGFDDWLRGLFLRYPRTPRNSGRLVDSEAREHGFELIREERFEDTLPFSLPEFSLFLATQSNAVEAIERGQVDEQVFRAEVECEASGFFEESKVLSVVFAASIIYLRPIRQRPRFIASETP